MHMSNNADQITLIIPASQGQSTEYEDKGGGEQHGLKEVIQTLTGTKVIDSNKLKENLETTMNQLEGILANLSKKAKENWEVESIAVGLSITGEGSVGIATVGVETSIEVSFRPK